MMKRFRSERFVFSVKTENSFCKVMQVIFGKSDGSIFVNFPYFCDSVGLVSAVTLQANSTFPKTVDLTSGGKVTSHLVKYSHHPDGRAHFSQHGYVKAIVQKQSIPLRDVEDHIFTVQLQGIHGFAKVDTEHELKDPNERKTLLTFQVLNSVSDTYKITGRWYSDSSLRNRVKGLVEGPIILGETKDGKKIPGFLIASPPNFPLSNYVLMVCCESVPKLSEVDETALTFMGGFDPPAILNNHSLDTRFLFLSYPTSNYDDLKDRIGTIDL